MRMWLSKDIFSFSFGHLFSKNVIFIHFENKKEYREILKKMVPKAKWSPQFHAWYVPDTNTYRKSFLLPLKLYSGDEILQKIHPVNQSFFVLLIQNLRLQSYSENTIKTYAVEFAQWLYVLQHVSADTISPEDLKSYFLYCVTDLQLSENQIHSRLNALKFFYEKILNRPKFFFDIPRPKKKVSLPKVLSKEEIIRLFQVTHNTKHLVILKLCYGLGLRVSEIVQLKISSIDSQRMMVHIENAKGKKDRYVPLPESILLELRTYYREYKPKEYLFENHQQQPMSVRTVQKIFKDAMDKAHIYKKVGIHGLRHSYATHLLELGTDMSFIQKLLGHNHIKTTQVYAKVSNTFLSKVVSPLDTLYLHPKSNP